MRKFAIGAAVVGALLGVSACSGTSSEAPATPTPLTIRGTVTLEAPATVAGVIDGGVGDCHGLDGYSDMTPGAAVIAKDQAGVIVGKGTITDSNWTDDMHRDCALSWTVTVPIADVTFYQLEIGTRPAYVVSADEAARPVTLTLG